MTLPSNSLPSPPDLSQSITFVWTLVAGFLVMFMQAGFALVETGMCRAKNAAHTMSMNFLVYALGMVSFFVCGFAFMFGGINGAPGAPAGHPAPIGGPASLGLAGAPVLGHMLSVPLAGKHWGLLGASGFFLAAHASDPRVALRQARPPDDVQRHAGRPWWPSPHPAPSSARAWRSSSARWPGCWSSGMCCSGSGPASTISSAPSACTATCIAWNLLAGGAVFYTIGRLLGSNRVSPEVELAGLDIPEMGAPGYPEFITQISQEQVTASEIAAVKSKHTDF